MIKSIFTTLLFTAACALPASDPESTSSANQGLCESGSSNFPATGQHLTHTNVVTSGQPTELNVVRTTDYPTGNSSIVYGDNYHYWTTLVGQVAAISTEAYPDGRPKTWYFLVRPDGINAAQASKFEISDNLAGEYAWEVEPKFNGTTSEKFGPLVTQATIDLMRPGTSLQVRSVGDTVLEVTPSPEPDETSLLVRRNSSGAFTTVKVLQGPVDSCGTGHRCLMVDN